MPLIISCTVHKTLHQCKFPHSTRKQSTSQTCWFLSSLSETLLPSAGIWSTEPREETQSVHKTQPDMIRRPGCRSFKLKQILFMWSRSIKRSEVTKQIYFGYFIGALHVCFEVLLHRCDRTSGWRLSPAGTGCVRTPQTGRASSAASLHQCTDL